MRTHSRVYTFRTHETRTGPAALYTPGTAVSTRPGSIPGRRLPHLSGMSLSSRQNHPAQDVRVTRHQQGFPGSRPSGPFPSPVAAMAGAAALGLFRELRTRPVRNRPRTSRRGQVEHHLLLCLRHQPDLLDQHTHHVRPRVATLTTCDLVSQSISSSSRVAPVHCCTGAPSGPCMRVSHAHGPSKPRRAVQHRLEDPAPQPPYLLRRSSGPFTEVFNLPFGSGICSRFASKAHLPTSAPLRARAPGSLSGQLCEHRPGGDPALRHSLSCCLSAAGIRFLSTLSRQGLPPLLRSAYRRACAYPRLRGGPWRGLHVPHA